MKPTTTMLHRPDNSPCNPSKYNQAFEGHTHATAYCQVVVDGENNPVDFIYLEVNDAYERMTGLGRDAVVGHRFSQVYSTSKANTAEIIAERARVARTGQESHSEQYFEFLNRWLSVYLYSPQKGYFVSVFLDITERKQAEQERDHFFNLSLDLLAIASFDGNLSRVNAAWTRCVGWSSQEITTRPWLSFVHPEDHAATLKAGATLFQGGEIHDFQNRFQCKDGSYRWFSWNCQPLRETRQIFAVVRDITVQRRTAHDLQDSRDQLRALAARLQTIREEQSAQIAREIHDVLAQELTRLMIDLVWMEKRLSSPINEPITETVRAALAARILDARVQADTAITSVQKIATELRPVILDNLGLYAAVEWLVEEFARHMDLAWTVAVPDVDTESDAGALPDRDRSIALFRILQQSLTNVARHAKATAVDVRLTLQAGELVLLVMDDGVGILAEQINNVHSIGLVGMRERVLAFGGSVDFEGSPGGGTTVTVRVPLETSA